MRLFSSCSPPISRACLLPTVLSVTIALTGCSPDAHDRGARRWSIGDTLVVESSAPIHLAPATLVPVTRYGSFDAMNPSTLVRVRSLAIAPDGNVVLYDQDEGIKRFDVGGEFESWVAKAGKGPREVGYVSALAVGATGQVAAFDLGSHRLLFVEPDGSSRTIPLSNLRGRYHEDALHYREAGTFVVGVHPPFTAQGLDPTPRLAYLRFDPELGLRDSLFVPSAVWERCPVRSERRFRVGFWEDQRLPYLPKALWALAPDGTLALGCPDRYEFDLRRPDGTVLRIKRVGADRVPLTSEQQEFLAKWAGLPRMPDERPVYARLVLPPDGRIWVWPNQPMAKWIPSDELRRQTGESVAWELPSHGSFDVFEPDGRWLGRSRFRTR